MSHATEHLSTYEGKFNDPQMQECIKNQNAHGAINRAKTVVSNGTVPDSLRLLQHSTGREKFTPREQDLFQADVMLKMLSSSIRMDEREAEFRSTVQFG